MKTILCILDCAYSAVLWLPPEKTSDQTPQPPELETPGSMHLSRSWRFTKGRFGRKKVGGKVLGGKRHLFEIQHSQMLVLYGLFTYKTG